MARNLAVTVTSTTFLFFLFTSAYGRAPLDLTANDAATTTTSQDHNLVDLTNSDRKTKTTIILPSEKPETEPATFVELEPEETETLRLTDTESKHERTEAETTESVPLTVITFRPINRHFARRPLLPFRRGRGCHQNRFNKFKLRGGQQRSYGDDMIVSGGEDLGIDLRVPVKWTRLNHGGRRFSFLKEEAKRDEMNDRPRVNYRHHHHHLHDDEDHKHEYYKGGFMKGIRKFLNNF